MIQKIRLDGHSALHGICITAEVIKLTDSTVTVRMSTGTVHSFDRVSGIPLNKKHSKNLQARHEDLRELNRSADNTMAESK